MTELKNALVVGVGGSIGAVMRYLTGVLVAKVAVATVFPYATLIVNIAGCFLIGILGTLSQNANLISPSMQLFLIVGLLGGFTTYSALGYQTVDLTQHGRMMMAILNVGLHLIMGLAAVIMGQLVAQKL